MNGQDRHKADNARRTPYWLIEAARAIMGGIDLDPASDEEAQKLVRAAVWYDSSGLKGPWCGRVWLNPPGGYAAGTRQSSAAVWWDRLVLEYAEGCVAQALFLAFSLNVFRTGQSRVAPYEFPFIVFSDRIRYLSSAGANTNSPNVDSALIYLPPHANTSQAVEAFKKRMSPFGKVRI